MDIAQLVNDVKSPVFNVLMVIGSGRRRPSALRDGLSFLLFFLSFFFFFFYFLVSFYCVLLSAFLTVGIRQLNDLTNTVRVYEALLKELCSKLDSQTIEYVERVIEKVRRPFV